MDLSNEFEITELSAMRPLLLEVCTRWPVKNFIVIAYDFAYPISSRFLFISNSQTFLFYNKYDLLSCWIHVRWGPLRLHFSTTQIHHYCSSLSFSFVIFFLFFFYSEVKIIFAVLNFVTPFDWLLHFDMKNGFWPQ